MVALVAACGGEKKEAGYPPEAEGTFMASCEVNSGSTAACECALGKIEKRMPYKEFVKADIAMRGNGEVSAEAQDVLAGAVAECGEDA